MSDYPDFEQKPFRRKHLETTDVIVNIRLNEDERQMLMRMRDLFRCDQNATVFKKCMEYTQNALHGQSQQPFIRWLSESRRVRPGKKT